MKIDQIAINSISTRHKDLEEALAAYAGAGGWDTANAISRLLHGMPGGSAAGLPPATQVLTNPSGAPYPRSTPTTMGSAASSMVAPAIHRRWRGRVVAGPAR